MWKKGLLFSFVGFTSVLIVQEFLYQGEQQKMKTGKNLFDFSVKTPTGEVQALSAFKGKVCLVVNVATQ